MFTLTSAAAQQVRQAALASGAQEMALRIAASIDPDGAVQFGMGFDDPKDEDMKLDLDGIAVVIAEDYQPALENIVLDYVELEPGQFHFIFMDASQCPAQADVARGGCSTAGCSSGGCSGASKGPTH